VLASGRAGLWWGEVVTVTGMITTEFTRTRVSMKGRLGGGLVVLAAGAGSHEVGGREVGTLPE
jgi:hypothetical protein